MKHILKFILKHYKLILNIVIIISTIVGLVAYAYGIISHSDLWICIGFFCIAIPILLIYVDFIFEQKWR